MDVLRDTACNSSSHKDLPEDFNDAAAPKQLIILAVRSYTARTDALDLLSMVKSFVSAKIRRSNYFGKF